MARTPGQAGLQRLGVTPLLVFMTVFLGASYLLTPEAPGRPQLKRIVTERTTDQHFRNCAHARSQGRWNIPRWDPSYRPHLDRDRDGLACEPWRGRSSREHRGRRAPRAG